MKKLVFIPKSFKRWSIDSLKVNVLNTKIEKNSLQIVYRTAHFKRLMFHRQSVLQKNNSATLMVNTDDRVRYI